MPDVFDLLISLLFDGWDVGCALTEVRRRAAESVRRLETFYSRTLAAAPVGAECRDRLVCRAADAPDAVDDTAITPRLPQPSSTPTS